MGDVVNGDVLAGGGMSLCEARCLLYRAYTLHVA